MSGVVRKLLVAVVVAVALAAPAAASAHATLESTTPQRGATVNEVPGAVVFRFSEPWCFSQSRMCVATQFLVHGTFRMSLTFVDR